MHQRISLDFGSWDMPYVVSLILYHTMSTIFYIFFFLSDLNAGMAIIIRARCENIA